LDELDVERLDNDTSKYYIALDQYHLNGKRPLEPYFKIVYPRSKFDIVCLRPKNFANKTSTLLGAGCYSISDIIWLKPLIFWIILLAVKNQLYKKYTVKLNRVENNKEECVIL